MANETNEDAEIVFAYEDLRLRVSPYGASLRGVWREKDGAVEPIITAYSGKENKLGGQGDVLIPFPGRVKDGQYTFEGRTYLMPRNDKDGPNAIHGFVRTQLWRIAEHRKNRVTFVVDYAPDTTAYPAALQASVTYSLDEDGMTCRFSVKNIGYKAAPVGVGFHPYFVVSDGLIDADVLQLPMRSVLEFDDVLIPTGDVLPVADTPLDFMEPRAIGATRFNTCYLDPIRDEDGNTNITLSSPETGRSTTVWMDDAFGFVVLYSGDPLPDTHRRRSLAIEPMTCGSDAFNHPEWGLVSLPAGETFSGTWGVTVL
jgi:aldose 1-epimerase